MSGLYYTELANWCRAAGLKVVEYSGWQTRARSSGGFASAPLGIQWHHTAGSGSNPQGDCDYMWRNANDRPIGNVYLARDGTVWVGAAGAANTAGKGGPYKMSRGTVPLDKGNTTTFAIEAANNGVGQEWPEAQINAFFILSNMLNAKFGNQPSDLFTHQAYAPTRKIDPSTAAAVRGAWKPRSCTGSGSWNVDDVKSECGRRAGKPTPPPTPTPEPEPEPGPTPPPSGGGYEWMASLPTIKKGDSGPYVERMQHLLAAAGYMNPANTANYDGNWGSGTDGAKANFDRAFGLGTGSDTSCGPKSWESLMTGRKW